MCYNESKLINFKISINSRNTFINQFHSLKYVVIELQKRYLKNDDFTCQIS